MTEKINPSDVNEDDILADVDEEHVHVPENEVDDVKSVMTNLSKSLQIMVGSMQAMEVSPRFSGFRIGKVGKEETSKRCRRD